MKIPGIVGKYSMALACKASQSRRRGVIINEHTLTAAQTRVHVDAFSRWFDLIHYDELLDRLVTPRARPFCLLTFDDGKRSNATETARELERLGVPAVFYVVTRFLTDGASLWFDIHDAIVRSLGRTPQELEIETLKSLPLDMLSDRLDRARNRYGVKPVADSDDVRPMSWDEARDLNGRGFTIGSHSLRHSILTCQTEVASLSDIKQSIQEVASEIGSCRTFAFPNGNYTGRLARQAMECGVETVMTTEPMWVDERFPFWRLPRLQFFGDDSLSRIELKLAAAATGMVLANPDGTGRAYRSICRSGHHSRHSFRRSC